VKLTARLVGQGIAVMAVVLVGVSLLTLRLVYDAARDDVDEVLREQAAGLVESFAAEATVVQGLDGVLSAPEAAQAAQFALTVRPSGARHVAVITLGDRELQGAGGPSRLDALVRAGDRPSVEVGRLRTADTDIGPLRVLDVEVLDASGSPLATVSTLASLTEARAAAGSARRQALLAGAAGLVIGGVALALVVRRALRGLREVSAAAATITPDQLGVRVPVPVPDDEVAELAREINDMLARIDADDDVRRRYLAAVSHEVRTPLAVAEGHLELLAQGTDDPAVATAAITVRTELDRLSRILDDLMAIARGREQHVRVDPVFLPDMFDSIAQRVRALGQGDLVEVVPPPPVVVDGDQARLEQCVANLIDNAITHTADGTRVTVAATATDASVELSVTDDGDGIDPSVRDRVLEPFVSTRSTGARRSSGLGLAVVDALVRAQHGELTIGSGPEGTSVTIRLPQSAPGEL
jgi:signal transduction histidine kinase